MGFRRVTARGSEGREALETFFKRTKNLMPFIGDAAKALARQIGRVAQEVISFRTKGSKLTVLQQIFRSIKRAAKPMADILINTFKNLGPEIAKLLPEATRFFRVVARNEGPIVLVVRA